MPKQEFSIPRPKRLPDGKAQGQSRGPRDAKSLLSDDGDDDGNNDDEEDVVVDDEKIVPPLRGGVEGLACSPNYPINIPPARRAVSAHLCYIAPLITHLRIIVLMRT